MRYRDRLERCVLRICFVTEVTEPGNQRGEALTVDELHRVVMNAALAANCVHRNDPLVLHVGRGERLGLEPLELVRVDRRGKRQDLERYPPPERDLFGLVNDTHSPAADLAQQSKVTELADSGMRVVGLILG